METTTPAPVVFKSINRVPDESCDNVLKLTFCNIEFCKSESPYGYYLLAAHSDPFNHLKLYQSAMNKLNRNLELAFKEVAKMEQEQTFSDNELYDCGVINSHKKMEVHLVISTFKGCAHVWLRLYTKNDLDQIIPTKFGVRFSSKDDAEALGKFITQNK